MNREIQERTVRAGVRALGRVRGRQLVAEILAEFVAEDSMVERVEKIEDLGPWFAEAIGAGAEERFAAVFMDTGKRILGKRIYPTCTRTRCILYPRQIIHEAMELGATIVALAHNHPGGSLFPSSADREMIRRIAMAGEPLEISFEGFIVSGSGFRMFD